MTSNTLLPALGRLLQRCVVEVRESANPPGTGAFVGNAFFVQPNLVITCAHVLRDAGGEKATLHWLPPFGPNDGKSAIKILSVERYPAEEPDAGSYPFPDLAMLHVEVSPGAPVDWVLLGHVDPPEGTRVFARGISRHSADSVINGPASPAGLTLDVASYSADFLRVRADRVEKGMSGSPVVEPSTGRVIGMIKASRHLELELGGLVLPVTAIRSRLAGRLQRHHEEDAERRWYEALHTPLQEEPRPTPPTPVRRAATYLTARESLSYLVIGAALLLSLLSASILLIRPAEGSAGITGLLAPGLVGCAMVALVVTVVLLVKLARWFHALSEGLRHGHPASYHKALRWTTSEVAACAVLLLALPKRPLPMAAVLALLILGVGTLHSLRHSTVRKWCRTEKPGSQVAR